LLPVAKQKQMGVIAMKVMGGGLGLPISLAVVGVASIEQLKANIAVVNENTPMRLTERQDLEELIA
jgi:hypothetical protein